jgi:hypothetical protein
MSISATERLLILGTALFGAYRYLTGEWPVGIEIEQVEE